MEEQGYMIVGSLWTSNIDGIWNQNNSELWMSVIHILIEYNEKDSGDCLKVVTIYVFFIWLYTKIFV